MYNISYNVFVIFKTYSPRSQLFQPGVHSLGAKERFMFKGFCRLLLLSPPPSQPSIWKLTYLQLKSKTTVLPVCLSWAIAPMVWFRLNPIVFLRGRFTPWGTLKMSTEVLGNTFTFFTFLKPSAHLNSFLISLPRFSETIVTVKANFPASFLEKDIWNKIMFKKLLVSWWP